MNSREKNVGAPNVMNHGGAGTRDGATIGWAAASTLALVLLLAVPSFAQGPNGNAEIVPESPEPVYVRTLVVSPVPGDPIASGVGLLEAMDSVSPTATDRWLMVIEPGIYDIGTNFLAMKPYMDIQGSGVEVTTIRGLGQDSHTFHRGQGVVIGADDAEIRFLTIRCVPDPARDLGACIVLANPEVSPRLRNLRLVSEGYGTHWGMRNTGSEPQVVEVSISLSGGDENYGIVNAAGSRPAIRRSVVRVDGGQLNNFGLYDRDGSLSRILQDTEIEVRGGERAIGMFAAAPAGMLEVQLLGVKMEVGDAVESYGILDGDIDLRLRGTQITAEAPGSAVDLAAAGTVEIFNSELEGDAVAVRALEIEVGSTLVRGGGEVTGIVAETCGGLAVFGSESPSFYPDRCPDLTALEGVGMSRSPVAASGYPTELAR